jgi:hypothetical protein
MKGEKGFRDGENPGLKKLHQKFLKASPSTRTIALCFNTLSIYLN